MDAKEMGKFIANRRKELHMTQAELGAKVGVTDKATSRWERGVGFPDFVCCHMLYRNCDCLLLCG